MSSEAWATVKTILDRPEGGSANDCSCSDDCYFAPRSADAQPCEEMREADMHLLQTFLYGLCSQELDTEEMSATRVCDLVDIFGPSAGPAGKGWSCLQVSSPNASQAQLGDADVALFPVGPSFETDRRSRKRCDRTQSVFKHGRSCHLPRWKRQCSRHLAGPS